MKIIDAIKSGFGFVLGATLAVLAVFIALMKLNFLREGQGPLPEEVSSFEANITSIFIAVAALATLAWLVDEAASVIRRR